MGLFSPPPPPPQPPRTDFVGIGASAVVFTAAALCVYSASRHTSQPAGTGLAYQLAGFLVSVASVSIPGRFDSDVDPKNISFPWPTLLNPAGFAFAIWGVIYLGELIGIVILVVKPELAALAAPSSRAWAFANVGQALWCASFRPWALDKLWLSSACLGATAACLVLSQTRLISDVSAKAALLEVPPRPPLVALVTYPRSLHAGWVTAACLVNLNAWAGKAAFGPARSFAAAVMSLVGAAALADYYAASGLKLANAAISWALFALSKGAPTGADAHALGPIALDGLATACAATAALAALAIVVRLAA